MSSNTSKSFDILVGSETGLLKGVQVHSKAWCNVNTVKELSKEKEVTVLCWGDTGQSQVCVGHRDRTVDVYSTESKEIINTYTQDCGEGMLRGLSKYNSGFLSCTDKGDLKLWDDTGERLSIEAGDNISVMRHSQSQQNLVATGGKENDLQIWNLEEPKEPVFKAKNVRNDWLNLRVPVWVTDAAFIPDSSKIVTCTGHHQVRVYDPSTPQRRPVLEVEVDEYPLTCMCLRPGYSQVIVGNTHGLMALVDLRGKGHMVQKYKGFAGGIRSVQCHPTKDVVVSCGLDRFLRIHDVNEKHLLHKFYLKSRLNCLLVADEWDNQSEGVGTANKSEADLTNDVDSKDDIIMDDSIWEQMEQVGSKSKKTMTKSVKHVKEEVEVKEEDEKDSDLYGVCEETIVDDSDGDDSVMVEKKSKKIAKTKKRTKSPSEKDAPKKRKSKRK